MKRKVASLPAVSAEEFQRRVIAQREATEAAESPSAGTYCNACGKHFGTPKSYDNHVKSKKHQEAVAKAESAPPAAATKQSKATSPSKEIMEALAGVSSSSSHMVALKNAKNAIEHGPRSEMAARGPSLMALANRPSGIHPEDEEEEEDDDDEEMDEDSEWESIDGEEEFEEGDEEEEEEEEGRVPPTECLFCGEAAGSMEANLAHMGAVHSFFLPDAEYLVDAEGLLTYLGYKLGVGHCCLWCGNGNRAPFRSLHAARQHMRDKGHCKLSHEGAEGLMEYSDFYDYTSSYPDEGEREGGGAGDGEEEVDVPAVLDGQGWQLVLPSGAVAGHRSLARYYRQNLPVVPSKARDSAQRVLSQYRALGWTGSTTREEAQKKARDIRFMQNVRAKQQMQLGCRANKLQKHFRQQVLF